MQVRSINSYYRVTPPFFKNISRTKNYSYSGDIISFSAKKYDSDSIINPTNHCAYCGCKVYNEQQLDSIAKEILGSKSTRLEGKIKSVLEKLEGAKYAEEIALAKRMANEDQINFFKSLLESASKKSFLKGDILFSQLYNADKDKAYEILIENLQPLKRTIDHVSPQREDEENKDTDINLVEACYCCNHDLKKGNSFNEFYTMFPSIKNNMPKEKFEYATAHLTSSSTQNIRQRLSASNLLKMLERLFVQKTETENTLESINFRIKNCKTNIADAIVSCNEEIRKIENKISQLEARLSELKQDPEYSAMLERINYQSQSEALKTAISSLTERRQRVSNSINELRNPSKSAQNSRNDILSEEEKEKRLTELKNTLFSLEAQISQKRTQLTEVQSKLEELDKNFPPIEIVQRRKSIAEKILSIYAKLENSEAILAEKITKKNEYAAKKQELEEQLQLIPEMPINPDEYREEEKLSLTRYKELADALNFIEEHPNGGAMRIFINKIAREQMEQEISELQETPIVKRYLQDSKRVTLEKELEDTEKHINDIEKQISDIITQIEQFRKQTSKMSKNKAESEVQKNSATIRRLTDKQNHIKIPQRISALKAEIVLLDSTIDDLIRKQEEIDRQQN